MLLGPKECMAELSLYIGYYQVVCMESILHGDATRNVLLGPVKLKHLCNRLAAAYVLIFSILIDLLICRNVQNSLRFFETFVPRLNLYHVHVTTLKISLTSVIIYVVHHDLYEWRERRLSMRKLHNIAINI